MYMFSMNRRYNRSIVVPIIAPIQIMYITLSHTNGRSIKNTICVHGHTSPSVYGPYIDMQHGHFLKSTCDMGPLPFRAPVVLYVALRDIQPV